MRTVSLVLALAACAPAEAPLAPDAAQLPPNQPLTLTLSPLIAGQQATVTVTGAAPGGRVDLYRASALRSSCFTLASGACALLSGAPTRVGTLTADAAGRAVVRFPLRVPGDRLVLQAFQGPNASDAAFGWIHPAGTPLTPGGDLDGDGFTPALGDCLDTDATIHPAAFDPPADGADRNCDGVDSMDRDRDRAEAAAVGGDDCDDTTATIAPGLADPLGDGVDANCDGVDGMDNDGDGYPFPIDCDDTTATISPGLADPLGDGVDANCDGVDGHDNDRDGYAFPIDCDDTTATISPGLADPLGDGVDANCDGVDGMDNDGDGYPFPFDCDDTTATISPGLADPLGDGVDANCDGVDGMDNDGDGYPFPFDCDDTTATTAPGLADPIGDGVDANCDGVDGMDNDGDGYPFPFDCDDTTATVAPGLADPTGDALDANCDGSDGLFSPGRPDFDGDGFADLAIGAPGDAIGSVTAGRAFTLSGGFAGVSLTGGDAWARGAGGVPGGGVTGARFGGALAAGDFDGDGYDDLVVASSAPQPPASPGAVDPVLLRGGPAGLSFHQALPNFEMDGDEAVLAAGDFNGDGFDDLLQANPGAFSPNTFLFHGGPTGLSYAQLLSAGAGLGRAVAVGDVNGDGYDDFVLGQPDLPGSYQGRLRIHHGSASLPHTLAATWDQDSAGVPGDSEDGDRWGDALALGDIDGDGFDDLVVGAPYENVDMFTDTGWVTVLRGSPTGLTTAGSVDFGLDLSASPHTLLGQEHFGWAVTTCDVNGDGRAEVAASAPGWCAFPSRGGAGCGRVLLIPATGALVDVNAALSFDQHDAGIPTRTEDRFGEQLSCADLNADGYSDLLVGSPGLNAPGDSGARRGGVFVYPGGPLGIDPTSPQHLYEEALDFGSASAQGDLFGQLAAPVR